MRFYEFESRQLLGKFGIPSPQGGVAKTAAEAQELAEKIGCPVVVKAHVLVRGRGKLDAVKFADSPEQAGKAAAEILALELPSGKPVSVAVEKKDLVRSVCDGPQVAFGQFSLAE